MKTLTINGTPYSFPEEWTEVTYQQYLRLVKRAGRLDTIGVIAAITGIDYDELFELEVEVIDSEILIDAVSGLAHPPDWESLPIPETLKVGAKTIRVPKSIRREPLGPKIVTQEALAHAESVGEPYHMAGAKIVAAYLYKDYYPEHNKEHGITEENLQELEALVQQLPVVEVLPVVNFYVRRWATSLLTKKSIVRSLPTPIKSQQESTDSKNSAPSSWLTRLRMAILPNGNK